MSRTRRKFDEAHFFYQRMEDHHANHPQFDYYLSAFISAARSVLWVMRAEYHLAQGWESWFSAKQATPVEGDLLRKINDIRIRSEKTHPLEARIAAVLHIPPEMVTPELKERLAVGKRLMLAPLQVSESGDVALPDGFPTDSFVCTFEGFTRHIDEFPDEDIVGVCTRYLRFLEEVVAECEANHTL